MLQKGIIFDIKRYAIHDGPGIRTTVFFKGCPLRCWWCHNPEGLVMEPELMFRGSRCIKECEECIKSCARCALSRVDRDISIDRKACDLCGECVQVCPSEALEIMGREVSVLDVMKEIDKELVFYDESGGGVTFSGGEPLLQPEFLESLLKECKDREIHTTIDTCGYVEFKVIEKIKDYVDFFLYDVKIIEDKKHKEYTGVSNKLILENLKNLAKQGKNIAVRIPVISGVNDDSENINKIGVFILSLQKIKDISLLPYHKAGSEKYKRLNKMDRMNETQPPLNQKIVEIKQHLEQLGFKVKIGG